AYEAFIHHLDDRRRRGLDRRRKAGGQETSEDVADLIGVRLEWRGTAGSSCAISKIAIARRGGDTDELEVGGVQDSDDSHLAALELAGSDWTEPHRLHGSFARSFSSIGRARFRAPGAIEAGEYDLSITAAPSGAGTLSATIAINGEEVAKEDRAFRDA